MRALRTWPLVALSGCQPFPLDPISLDVSSNCAEAEVIVRREQLHSAYDWHTVVAAAADAPGVPGAWLLVIGQPPGGLDQLELVHLDDDGVVDHRVPQGVSPGFADEFELIPGAEPGEAWLSQRSPGIHYVGHYDAREPYPQLASSSNLATLAVPCDADGDGDYESCDASAWFQALVFMADPAPQPYVITFPPSSVDFSIEIVPTRLDLSLSPTYPLDPDRTLDFAPQCDEGLPPEEIEACQAAFAGRHYPSLAPMGLLRDARSSFSSLVMYRETAQDDGPVTTADVPLFTFAIGGLDRPAGLLRVDPTLPTPRADAFGALAIDHNATYFAYAASDGEPVLVRAPHAGLEFVELGRTLGLEGEVTLLQLDADIAIGRIVDGAWEVLKLFPDSPAQSRTTSWRGEADVIAVDPAGPGSFVVYDADGEATLVQVRCAAPSSP